MRFEQGLGVAPWVHTDRDTKTLDDAFALHWNGNRKPWDLDRCDEEELHRAWGSFSRCSRLLEIPKCMGELKFEGRAGSSGSSRGSSREKRHRRNPRRAASA